MLDFSHIGMLKFKYKGQSLTITKACQEILGCKSEWCDDVLGPYLHVQKTKNEKK